MNPAGRVLAVALIVALVTSFGCGKGQKSQSSTPTATSSVPLPKWAPKSPSPEFIRAAKVLKPMPDELLKQMIGRAGHENVELVMKIVKMPLPAAWEFFGTLNDEQVSQFRTTGRIHIPMGDLNKQQRAALDRFIEVYDKAREGDTLVNFYKGGAKKDLSNVAIGFRQEANVVVIVFAIRDAKSGAEAQIDNLPFAVL